MRESGNRSNRRRPRPQRAENRTENRAENRAENRSIARAARSARRRGSPPARRSSARRPNPLAAFWQRLTRRPAQRPPQNLPQNQALNSALNSAQRPPQIQPLLPYAAPRPVAARRPSFDREAVRQRLAQSRGRLAPPRSTAAPITLRGPRSRSGRLALYATRLMIMGIGMGVLAGTILSIWDPASRYMAGASSSGQPPIETASSSPTGLKLDQELAPLKAQLLALTGAQANLRSGLLLVDLDNHRYVDINGSETFPAASTIKLPILVAFFQDVDAGKIQLGDPLTMRPELVAKESGEMQYQPTGTKFTALDTATSMITVSDNTATNMLIDRLGGAAALNQRFQAWGLSSTLLQNPLPDVSGTNTTSAKDMAQLLNQLHDGKLVSMKSRDRMLDILHRTENDSLLPKGLGQGAAIAHKTGTLGSLVADVGMIDMPNGKRYLAAVLVTRPRDDERAQTLIQQISRVSYQAFSQEPADAKDSLNRARVAAP
jgi:beta-lactamase class A